MEHNNYERELKYLVQGGKLPLMKILELFDRHGYRLIKFKQKEKQEVFYDDENLTLLNNHDTLKHSSIFKKKRIKQRFMYKKNISQPDKPYISKLEVGSGKYTSLDEFLAALNLNLPIQHHPFMHAKMTRDTAVIEKSPDDRLLLSLDKVKYFRASGVSSVFDEELEVECWTNPNTNGTRDYDAHLCEAHDILLASGLPLEHTRQSKHLRGHELLRE